MKVFVPVSDELFNKRERVVGRLVPFKPEYLDSTSKSGCKPANWIIESDYQAACRRLRESHTQTSVAAN